MKRLQASIASLLLIFVVEACTGTATGTEPALSTELVRDEIRISPMQYRYQTMQGLAYFSSEQFLLCRKKDLCPLDGHFTPEPTPEPSGEKSKVASPVSRKPERFVVYFRSAKAILEPDQEVTLKNFMAEVSEFNPSDLCVIIIGFTDNVGAEEPNRRLADKRARAVADYLNQHGYAFQKMIAGGRPLCCYVLRNTTDAERAKNRRAEIWVESISGNLR